MLKRSSKLEKESRGIKRPWHDLDDSSSFINRATKKKCSACIEELGYTYINCINLELHPKIYYHLALVIGGDHTIKDELQQYEDKTIQLLTIYAHRLAIDSKLTLDTALKLHLLFSDFEERGISKLKSVIKKTKLHHARELKFIYSCLSGVKVHQWHIKVY